MKAVVKGDGEVGGAPEASWRHRVRGPAGSRTEPQGLRAPGNTAGPARAGCAGWWATAGGSPRLMTLALGGSLLATR